MFSHEPFLTPITRKLSDEGVFRIIVCITAIVPTLAIFATGQANKRQKGAAASQNARPKGWFFAFIWAMITILWGWVTAVAAFHMELDWLAGFLTLHVVTTALLCVWSATFGRVSLGASAQILGVSLGAILLLWSLLTIAPPSPRITFDDASDARAAMVFPWVVAVAWAIYACVMNILDAGKKN